MNNEADNLMCQVTAKPPGAKRAELHLWYATLTVTVASGVMSTIGVYEVLAENRTYGLALSLLVGVVITAMLSGAWRYLFHAFPRAQGTQLFSLSVLMVPFLALVFLISTWTNATAIVGGPALNMHNRVFLDQYAQALETVNRQVEAKSMPAAIMSSSSGRGVRSSSNHSKAPRPGSGECVRILSVHARYRATVEKIFDGRAVDLHHCLVMVHVRLAWVRAIQAPVKPGGCYAPRP